MLCKGCTRELYLAMVNTAMLGIVNADTLHLAADYNGAAFAHGYAVGTNDAAKAYARVHDITPKG